MSAADDLLAQARFLVGKENRRPLQVSLRRSVSATYYALFHFMGEESSFLQQPFYCGRGCRGGLNFMLRD